MDTDKESKSHVLAKKIIRDKILPHFNDGISSITIIFEQSGKYKLEVEGRDSKKMIFNFKNKEVAMNVASLYIYE